MLVSCQASGALHHPQRHQMQKPSLLCFWRRIFLGALLCRIFWRRIFLGALLSRIFLGALFLGALLWRSMALWFIDGFWSMALWFIDGFLNLWRSMALQSFPEALGLLLMEVQVFQQPDTHTMLTQLVLTQFRH